MVEHTETHTCRSDKLVGVNKTAKRDPLPKPPGPWAWLSWLILVAYTIIFFEGLWVSQLVPSERGPALKRKLPHLCFVYALESALALGPGWCAMDGWTCGQVMQHHLPYIAAVTIAISLDLLGDWSTMATITLLTAANEGVLILIAMGAPEWIASASTVSRSWPCSLPLSSAGSLRTWQSTGTVAVRRCCPLSPRS